MDTFTDADILFDPHTQPPWKFPKPGTWYVGTIITTPRVAFRLDHNGNPQSTSDGAQRFALWTCVDTTDGYRGFCIESNPLAKAFGGRAGEKNLRRWAGEWQVGGQLYLSWTRDDAGDRVYRARYTGPPKSESGPCTGSGKVEE